jgi:hypothetical protein
MNTNQINDESKAIVDAVKAEAARVGVTGKMLAAGIGRDRNYIYERFRYEKSFDTNDLSAIAKVLGITLPSLFKSVELGMEIHKQGLAA